MRLGCPRLTVRGMMVAVAVVAVALSLIVLKRRSDGYRSLAGYHAARAMAESGTGPAESGFARIWTQQGEWHKRMREKYERAASRPWMPVEPDPPEPNSPSPTFLRSPAGSSAAGPLP